MSENETIKFLDIDEWRKCTDLQSFTMARRLLKEEVSLSKVHGTAWTVKMFAFSPPSPEINLLRVFYVVDHVVPLSTTLFKLPKKCQLDRPLFACSQIPLEII